MGDATLAKGRGPKSSYPEARTTLDALHSQKMAELIDETKNLPQYKQQIEALKAKIAVCTAITEIWSLEQQLGRLEKKVKSIESGDAVNDYYLRTGNILFEYYDIQDKIQKGASVSSQTTKAKPGSILAILGHLERKDG